MLGFWLDRRRRCHAGYETLFGDVYPVRCVRRRGHPGRHRAPFGLEWV